jgi:hypothetical protein
MAVPPENKKPARRPAAVAPPGLPDDPPAGRCLDKLLALASHKKTGY